MKQLLLVLTIALLASCHSTREIAQDYRYFEKHLDSLKYISNPLKEPVIQKNDQLSIQVSSATLNQEQTSLFNQQTSGAAATSGMALIGYLVDFDGNISMPVLGKVKAEGLTKTQLAKLLETRLEAYVKNPVVNIRILNYRVMLMGEVRTPGFQTFSNEKATIVDAIVQAGGLTDLGRRSNILVIREKPDGTRNTDTVDINDARIFASPVYQLQQNDIVYVSPNKIKLKNLYTDPTLYRDVPFFMGLITTSLAFLALFIKR